MNKSHALSGYLWWCELLVAPLASTKLARWPRSCLRFSLFGGLIVLVLGVLLGCTEDTTEQEDVSRDATQRVETNLLPELTDESEVVLRNLLNFLAVLPQTCAQPLAEKPPSNSDEF